MRKEFYFISRNNPMLTHLFSTQNLSRVVLLLLTFVVTYYILLKKLVKVGAERLQKRDL